jgi:hemoglobin
MKDIETREDIDLLMVKFYGRALDDELLGYIFTDVARIDLEKHLPIIGDFWDSMLFGSGKYQKHGRNPMIIHGELNAKSSLTFRHFRRWLEIFTSTVDEMFAGTRAELIKMRAEAIANRMLNFVTGVPSVEILRRENSGKIRSN